jgi:hypothetical protein
MKCRLLLYRDFAKCAGILPEVTTPHLVGIEVCTSSHHWSRDGKDDVVRTQFRVEQDGSAEGHDIWFYLKDGKWNRVPDDIIQWGEHAPDKQATLFIYQSTGQELCFYPPQDI